MNRRLRSTLTTGAVVALALAPEIRYSRERHGHRVALGPVEINLLTGSHPCVDLLLPGRLGSFLTATWERDPETAPDAVRRAQREGRATVPVLLNTGPLFLGGFGGNIAEVGIGRWGGLLTWIRADMRQLAPGSPTRYVKPGTDEPVLRS